MTVETIYSADVQPTQPIPEEPHPAFRVAPGHSRRKTYSSGAVCDMSRPPGNRATVDFKVELEKSREASLEQAVGQLLQQFEQTESGDFEERDRVAQGGLEALSRSMAKVANELLSEAEETSRKQLKAQSQWYDIKLDKARRGAAVQLKNQAHAIGAQSSKEVERRVGVVSADGSAALADANKRREEAEASLEHMTTKCKLKEEALNMNLSLYRANEAKLKKSEENQARLEGEIDDCQEVVKAALIERNVKPSSKWTLIETANKYVNNVRITTIQLKGERDRALRDLEDARRELQACSRGPEGLQEELRNVRRERDELSAALEEAGEIEKINADTATREIAAAESERLAAVDRAEKLGTDLEKILAEHAGMVAAHETAEAELNAFRALQSGGAGEVAALSDEVERLRGELSSKVGIEVNLRQDYDAAVASLSAVQEDLELSRSECNTIREELQSIKQQRRELVGAAEMEETLNKSAQLKGEAAQLKEEVARLNTKVEQNDGEVQGYQRMISKAARRMSMRLSEQVKISQRFTEQAPGSRPASRNASLDSRKEPLQGFTGIRAPTAEVREQGKVHAAKVGSQLEEAWALEQGKAHATKVEGQLEKTRAPSKVEQHDEDEAAVQKEDEEDEMESEDDVQDEQDFQTKISNALANLSIALSDNADLGEQLDALLKSIYKLIVERKTLLQQVEDLRAGMLDAEARVASLEDVLHGTGSEAAAHAKEAATVSVRLQAAVDRHKTEAETLAQEVERLREALNASNTSNAGKVPTVCNICSDCSSTGANTAAELAELARLRQAHEHEKRLRQAQENEVHQLKVNVSTAEQAIRSLSVELTEAAAALDRRTQNADVEPSDAKLLRLQQERKAEREAIVKAALRSLQQLRCHLTEALAGLRVKDTALHTHVGEGFGLRKATDRWGTHSKHRWGAISEKGEFDSLVVRLEPGPAPLGVRPVPILHHERTPPLTPPAMSLSKSSAALLRGGSVRAGTRRSMHPTRRAASPCTLNQSQVANEFSTPSALRSPNELSASCTVESVPPSSPIRATTAKQCAPSTAMNSLSSPSASQHSYCSPDGALSTPTDKLACISDAATDPSHGSTAGTLVGQRTASAVRSSRPKSTNLPPLGQPLGPVSLAPWASGSAQGSDF